MAYNISVWQADGPNGESEIKCIRLKSIDQAPEIIEYWSKMQGCVRITRERTGKWIPSSTKTLWIRPGYVDPF